VRLAKNTNRRPAESRRGQSLGLSGFCTCVRSRRRWSSFVTSAETRSVGGGVRLCLTKTHLEHGGMPERRVCAASDPVRCDSWMVSG
jgi:hypothetical protein